MPRQKKQNPSILQLFGKAESALAEVERNLVDSPQKLKRKLSALSWNLRDNKEALLEGLLKVAINLGLVGPWKLPGRGLGRIRIKLHSHMYWVYYTFPESRGGGTTALTVHNLLTEGTYTHLYIPVCEVLMQEIEKGISDLALTSKTFKQLLSVLQKAAKKSKRSKTR